MQIVMTSFIGRLETDRRAHQHTQSFIVWLFFGRNVGKLNFEVDFEVFHCSRDAPKQFVRSLPAGQSYLFCKF